MRRSPSGTRWRPSSRPACPAGLRPWRETANVTMEIVLVRHASTSWSGRRYCGRSGPPLSAVGEAEAADLAERLAPDLTPATRIVSSPSRRAVATGRAIAAAAGGLTVDHDARWL